MSNNEDKNSRIRLIVPEDNDKAEILPEKSESSLTVGLCFGLFFLFCLSLVFTTPLQLWHFTPAYFFESITSRFTSYMNSSPAVPRPSARLYSNIWRSY